jgi:maleamate amidohydrolase
LAKFTNQPGSVYHQLYVNHMVRLAVRTIEGAMDDFSDAKALYARKGLGSRIGWGARPAIIVVDMTNGFTDPGSPVGTELAQVIAETNRVLEVARASGVPIIFTSIAYEDPDVEGGHWVRKIPALRGLRKGTPAVDVDIRLNRKPSAPLIYKCYTSAFFGTHLPHFPHIEDRISGEFP